LFGGVFRIIVMADNKDCFEITILLMAQAVRDRRLYRTISRDSDASGHPVIPDQIKVNNGFVIAMAGHQDVLGSRLDEMVLMILDMDLHSDTGIAPVIAGKPYFLN
jgi:hypothetical protein